MNRLQREHQRLERNSQDAKVRMEEIVREQNVDMSEIIDKVTNDFNTNLEKEIERQRKVGLNRKHYRFDFIPVRGGFRSPANQY